MSLFLFANQRPDRINVKYGIDNKKGKPQNTNISSKYVLIICVTYQNQSFTRHNFQRRNKDERLGILTVADREPAFFSLML